VKLGKQKDLAGLIASLIVDIQREKEESVKVQKELKDRERRAMQYEGELKEFNTYFDIDKEDYSDILIEKHHKVMFRFWRIIDHSLILEKLGKVLIYLAYSNKSDKEIQVDADELQYNFDSIYRSQTTLFTQKSGLILNSNLHEYQQNGWNIPHK